MHNDYGMSEEELRVQAQIEADHAFALQLQGGGPAPAPAPRAAPVRRAAAPAPREAHATPAIVAAQPRGAPRVANHRQDPAPKAKKDKGTSKSAGKEEESNDRTQHEWSVAEVEDSGEFAGWGFRSAPPAFMKQ